MYNLVKMTLQSKSNWVLPSKETGEDVVKYLLEQRGIDEKEFLDFSLDNIPSSEKLHDSKKASERIVEAIKKEEKIVIHGDYDADGICGISILWEFLFREVKKHLNREVDVVPYIPARIEQGYGLTESSLDDVLSLGASLVISVDCGVRDKELINRYKQEKGLDFVITDHHQLPEDLGDSLEYPLVHPMFPKKEYPYTEVCGTFVAFLLIQAIKKELGIDNSIDRDTRGLDLVALATVTDLMPLLDVNRVVVKEGLKQIQKGNRLGLSQLIKVSGIQQNKIDSYHLGYILGPRINAVGRIGSPLDGVKLLVSDKKEVCRRIAEVLNETNIQRQYMTQQGLEEANEIVEKSKEKLLFVVNDDWHEGIVGLIAGRLSERYHRPVLVGTRTSGGIKGSARSISGFNITEALSRCEQYLERYGGHELAAGFSVKKDNEAEFSECIHEIAEKELTDKVLTRSLKIDLLLNSKRINRELVNEIERLEPFGYGNSKPLIALRELVIFKKQIMGKLGNHMKLQCKGDGIDLITLLLFNCDEDTQTLSEDEIIDVVGSVGINSWNGKENIQFLVKEWRYSS